MIKYTYDVDLNQYTRKIRNKYAEEEQIVKSLESGRNVLFEYDTANEAKKARDALLNYNMKALGKSIRTNIIDKTKVLVVVL